MVVVKYITVNGYRVETVGILAFAECEGRSPVALGGVTPEERGVVETKDSRTQIITDDFTRQLVGWVHPDQLFEVSGVEGEGVMMEGGPLPTCQYPQHPKPSPGVQTVGVTFDELFQALKKIRRQAEILDPKDLWSSLDAIHQEAELQLRRAGIPESEWDE